MQHKSLVKNAEINGRVIARQTRITTEITRILLTEGVINIISSKQVVKSETAFLTEQSLASGSSE